MMKTTTILSILLSFHVYANACSFSPDSFCQTWFEQDDRVVLSGVIVGVDSTGIDIEVLQVIRGEESRAIIRVWDGTDFDCNGPWSMAASDIGFVNDTIIIILPMITEIENAWDVIGDYRRPHPYVSSPELHINNGMAVGFISGIPGAPPEYFIWEIDFNVLINALTEDGDCSSIILSTKDAPDAFAITTNNPVEDVLYVDLNESAHTGYVKLYDLTGSIIASHTIYMDDMIAIEASHVPAGIYFLEVYTNGRRDIRKIIKG
jgi:hypothetical protein